VSSGFVPAADNRVDIDLKPGMFPASFESVSQNLKTFRNLIRVNVINRDLQIIASGFVKAVDFIGLKIITVEIRAIIP